MTWQYYTNVKLPKFDPSSSDLCFKCGCDDDAIINLKYG